MLADDRVVFCADADGNVLVGDMCDGKAKGGMGSVIVMVERNDEGEIVNYKAIQIDGDKYKEDTWYRLEDGEIKEVE